MDRYASRLLVNLRRHAKDLDIAVAGEIADLTTVSGADAGGRRTPGGTLLPRLPRLPTPGLNEARRYVARYWRYPRRVRRMRADLLHVLDHSYAHLLLGERRRATVVTVHDLLPVMTVRRGSTRTRDRIRNWLLGRVLRGLRQANAFIVSTEWIRHELAEWLGDAHRIHVIPFGVDDAFFEPGPTSRAELRERWDIPDDAFVVLHVGSVGTRKNVPALLQAVGALRKAEINAWLLQVGGTFSSGQLEEMRRAGLESFHTAIGEVPEPDLRGAYRAADVLLFPSHYEGFGFPVLEAMASGLPVVTSGAAALAEVAGDAAMVVGGRETEPYVAALRRIAEHRPWREQLVAKGLTRAKQFRWAETARKTAEVYRHLG